MTSKVLIHCAASKTSAHLKMAIYITAPSCTQTMYVFSRKILSRTKIKTCSEVKRAGAGTQTVMPLQYNCSSCHNRVHVFFLPHCQLCASPVDYRFSCHCQANNLLTPLQYLTVSVGRTEFMCFFYHHDATTVQLFQLAEPSSRFYHSASPVYKPFHLPLPSQ